MKTSESMFIITHGVQMYESLLKAIDDAGGTGSSFTPYHKLQDMSVAELITHLAPNNIRFIHVEEPPHKKETKVNED